MAGDEFDFNFEDLTPEEREELEREERERKEWVKKHPLRLKGIEIHETITVFIESLPKTAKEMYAGSLMESSLVINGKIAGALGSESWLICMQNASLIRYHAEYIHTATSGLKAFTKADTDYIKVLRNEMEEFKDLFVEWVSSFSQFEKEEYTDEWGLFLRE